MVDWIVGFLCSARSLQTKFASFAIDWLCGSYVESARRPSMNDKDACHSNFHKQKNVGLTARYESLLILSV